ncbi:ribonuclease E inhibitor RraB [Sandaracinobacter sp. RS1-74]|uniref:ribonuclease E inhibitor RraB n=1 Tax=Sandaracinobacteroides sayramensis TaxID=2913411 RepID=UPI001EDBB48D|nr:ribonuclease E inhibitor RraB [Sandaracinobacteroides sayramensis]MCG2840311.1 ribonuclease E inhibitor RraB [Sandaracinobacteroides sayramensis]
MTVPTVDPAKLAAEVEADAEVLKALAENGDIASVVRPIDLHFKGSQEAIEALVEDSEELGFEFLEFGEYEDGDIAADFIVEGTAEPAAMAALVERALQIEITHGVEFDGWGCEAQTGNAN